jgi:hypothetical protein
MKKSKKASSKIAGFGKTSEIKMNKVLGGSINYNSSKSNTGNLAAGAGTSSDTSAHG